MNDLDDGIGNGMFWMLYDASGLYTGHTLWPTRTMANSEKAFQLGQGNLPDDGKWRIRRIHVLVA